MSCLLAASVLKKTQNGCFDAPISADQLRSSGEESVGMVSGNAHEISSSLGLLALAYGNSDSEEDENDAGIPVEGCGTSKVDSPGNGLACDNTHPKTNCSKDMALRISDSNTKFGLPIVTRKDGEPQNFDCSDEFERSNCTANSLTDRFRRQMKSRHETPNSLTNEIEATAGTGFAPLEDSIMPLSSRTAEDSLRLHVFCLQHAMQVEKRLNDVGGAHVFLVCHPGEIFVDQVFKG